MLTQITTFIDFRDLDVGVLTICQLLVPLFPCLPHDSLGSAEVCKESFEDYFSGFFRLIAVAGSCVTTLLHEAGWCLHHSKPKYYSTELVELFGRMLQVLNDVYDTA